MSKGLTMFRQYGTQVYGNNVILVLIIPSSSHKTETPNVSFSLIIQYLVHSHYICNERTAIIEIATY